MEFNPREKALIIATSFLANDIVKQVPKGTLALGLKTLLMTKDINLDIPIIEDMIDAIQIEQQNMLKEGFGFIEKHKDHL